MKSRLQLFLMLVTVVAISGGCTTRPILDFTVLSTRSLPAGGLEGLERRETRAFGESGQQIFIVFPVGDISIRTSLERAISSVPGCVALVDGSITLQERIFFPFIYADSRIVIQGTPLIDPTRIENRGGPDRTIVPD